MYLELISILGISVAVAILGKMISYAPYANLAGFTVFVSGIVILALRQGDKKDIGEESLEGDSGESTESLSESLVKPKSKGNKRHRK